MKILSLFLSVIGLTLLGLKYFPKPFLIMSLCFVGGLIMVLVIDSLILKLPDSNGFKKWWRKNVVELTP